MGDLREGVGGVEGVEAGDGEAGVGGGDVELEVAPGTPPEGAVGAGVAVGRDVVADAFDVAVCDFVAIAFFAFGVVEGLGVGEVDGGVFVAVDGERGEGGGEGLAIEQDGDVGVGGDGDGLF